MVIDSIFYGESRYVPARMIIKQIFSYAKNLISIPCSINSLSSYPSSSENADGEKQRIPDFKVWSSESLIKDVEELLSQETPRLMTKI